MQHLAAANSESQFMPAVSSILLAHVRQGTVKIFNQHYIARDRAARHSQLTAIC